ncbi:DDT domain-containing protein DDR4 [Iris pallida]|uniref:DDT domain-containing protein DDR4 n=1 Tax=Iris pallida TaxID=29817 RepID=A0AAX6GMX4_IRIPA|nr:DDT domain-containing protein DDR4 [Iris pallida]
MELSTASHDSENLVEDGEQIMKDDKMNDYVDEPVEKEQFQPVEKIDKNLGQGEGVRKRWYLDLNVLTLLFSMKVVLLKIIVYTL